ncbi:MULTISPECIES: hypothetical protein [unclassified Actinotalea]|uniref:hypothetical protein n=1 Tax=unclassified Actinotalea TaxID=2638618 RepID=UPI0015F3E9D8|nr:MULTISPECIES: hypothetical protein [unclassified Actinotalea]
MGARPVPADALGERERQLLAAVHAAGVPAAELFGDARELAAEDAAELGTADEAVRTSQGGGLRPALLEAGATLVAIAVVGAVLTAVRSGWAVDVDLASVLVALSVTVAFLGWVAGRALFSAGRPLPAVGALVAVGALALAGIGAAAGVGPGHVLARDVPVPLWGAAALVPGVLALVAARRTRQPVLRESWDDAEWLRRFHHALRTRLVPSATARGHVTEVEQATRAGSSSAFDEFGHPVVLARQVADADRTARARRWWISTVAGTVMPLAVAGLILAMDSWGSLTIPAVVVLLLSAVLALAGRRADRPWVGRR